MVVFAVVFLIKRINIFIISIFIQIIRFLLFIFFQMMIFLYRFLLYPKYLVYLARDVYIIFPLLLALPSIPLPDLLLYNWFLIIQPFSIRLVPSLVFDLLRGHLFRRELCLICLVLYLSVVENWMCLHYLLFDFSHHFIMAFPSIKFLKLLLDNLSFFF